MTKIKVSEVGKSSNDIIIDEIISDDEIVASYVPRGSCFCSITKGEPPLMDGCDPLQRCVFIFDKFIESV